MINYIININNTLEETKMTKQRNPYLYKTKVIDYGENCTIWRLKILLKPEEWDKVKSYFKYYKNRNLQGWGTTSPMKVAEILVELTGDTDTKNKLEEINSNLNKILQSRKNGYGGWDDWDWKSEENDDYMESVLKKEKRELLGVI